MDGAVFPSCCLTWGQTMVKVMKIMVTSFKMSHAALNVPGSAAGHHWLTPLPQTPGHSWACLGQFLVGSLLLSSGSWCTQGFACALQSLFPQACVSSGGSMVGLMATSSKRAYAKPRFHWKRPWCWERLKMGGEGDDRGSDGWMAPLTRWMWVCVSSGSWWWTGKPGVLQSMGLQRVRHDWVTELNWSHLEHNRCQITFIYQLLM